VAKILRTVAEIGAFQAESSASMCRRHMRWKVAIEGGWQAMRLLPVVRQRSSDSETLILRAREWFCPGCHISPRLGRRAGGSKDSNKFVRRGHGALVRNFSARDFKNARSLKN
jgi:hypothetical protein